MTTPEEHRVLREMLGALALGHLEGAEEVAVRAHLDGCASCRAELDALAPAVAGLARVDPARLDASRAPSPDLGARIAAQVAGESRSEPAPRARWRRLAPVALAAAAVVLALAGFVVGRSVPQTPPGPREVIALDAVREPGLPAVTVEEAVLVPHTWGVEVRFTATGFRDGAVYDAWVRAEDGTRAPAGQFVGRGATAIVCQMQSAALRADSTAFVVADAEGDVVLRADLAEPRQG